MHRFIAPIFVAFASAAVHTVQVGKSGLSFSPQTITATKGDVVAFELFPGHNVLGGDFDSPCKADDDDFYSGPYSGTSSGSKKFVVNITSDDPLYFFCGTQGHCQGGMVGGINLPTSGSETLDAYTKAAANVDKSTTPDSLRGGELLDDAQIASLSGSSSSASATASGSSASASATGSAASSASASRSASASASRSASASASAASASASTGAASTFSAPISGFAAIVLGVAAWII